MQFSLIIRDGCHLCEEMIEALDNELKESSFTYKTFEVDADLYLRKKYSDKVPVLLLDNKEICHYFLDMRKLAKIINRENSTGFDGD